MRKIGQIIDELTMKVANYLLSKSPLLYFLSLCVLPLFLFLLFFSELLIKNENSYVLFVLPFVMFFLFIASLTLMLYGTFLVLFREDKEMDVFSFLIVCWLFPFLGIAIYLGIPAYSRLFSLER